MTNTAEAKRAARAAALARRADAAGDAPGRARQAAGHLIAAIGGRQRAVVSAYLPMGDEIDPLPAMHSLHGLGYRLCVPVTGRRGELLRFREWHPGTALVSGRMGIREPAEGAMLAPEVLIVPLLAFDRRGYRLGYGGGFYDRTLAALRAEGPVTAFGFAYAAQEVAAVPIEHTDERLDAVVTEAGVIVPASASA